nr:AAA family ATPase [uncultured Pseudomonas sp.]
MIIRSLTVSGENKVSSALFFERGANIVVGASDTGKSYVVQCIKFILGAEDPPKPIDESTGYTTLTVQFENDDGSGFTLTRELSEKAPIYLYEPGCSPRKLKTKHQFGDLNNLSNYFLDKISLSDKKLLQGKEKLTTTSLSLRNLEKVFVIDETRIVAEYSPLGTGQNNEATSELSLLRTLLTGVDDSEVASIKKDLASKSTLKQKVSTVEYLLERLYPEGRVPLETEIDELEENLEAQETLLELRERELNALISENDHLLNFKQSISINLSAAVETLAENQGLMDRLVALQGKYRSDAERLLGISEASGLLELYEEVLCPTCGSKVPHDHLENSPTDILPAVEAERAKIDFHLNELSVALADLGNTISTEQTSINSLRDILLNIETKLSMSFTDVLEAVNGIRDNCNELKRKILALRHKASSFDELARELDLLKGKLDEKQDDYAIPDFDSDLKQLAAAVENVLERWDFPNHKPTEFDTKKRDLVIGGKRRPHFGKGYRAIGFSSFVIGLMQHLSPLGRHPGFVVLDSPLTTYKQADQDRGEEQSEADKIAGDMVYSFYSDVAENYNNRQIIIFDNQEPDVSLIPSVTYYHFSKNRNMGRFGFFPPVDGKDYSKAKRP